MALVRPHRTDDDTGIIVLLSLLVGTVLWSPYFTVPGVPIGASLRADQLILPVFVGYVVAQRYTEFRVTVDYVLAGLLLVVVTIATSISYNAVVTNVPARLSDFFDVVVWGGYLLTMVTISGNVSRTTARRILLLTVVLSAAVAVLSVLEALRVPVVVERIAPIYTSGKHLETVRDGIPTGTATNPNTLAKLLAMPLFFSMAQWYRLAVGGAGNDQWRPLAFWFGLSCLFAAAILPTASRSGLASIVVGFLALLALLATDRLSDSEQFKLVTGAFVVVLAAGTYTLVVLTGFRNYDALLNPLGSGALDVRLRLLQLGIPVLLDGIVIGHGPSWTVLERRIGISTFDSGFFNWLYHYGIFGVATLVLYFIGGIRYGLTSLKTSTVFETDPVSWGAAAAITGSSAGLPIVWFVSSVALRRRLFMFNLLFLSLLIAATRD